MSRFGGFNWQPCNSRRRSPSDDSFSANPEPPGAPKPVPKSSSRSFEPPIVPKPVTKPSSGRSFEPPGIYQSLKDYPFGPPGTSKSSSSRSFDLPPPSKPRNALFPSARLSVAAQGK